MVNKLSVIIFLILALIAPCASYAANCTAGNLYVDYATGSDTNNGTSTSTPWKHSPGDANATDNANCTLIPDNTVNFKGGVYYKGKINVNASGTSGHPITFQGQPSGWGTGKAIIDGTAAITFNACTGQGTGATQCDNTNWASMYYATIPAGTSVYAIVFENSTAVPFSQLPDLSGSYRYGDIQLWRAISSGISTTQITDATLLISEVADYYVGMYVLHHAGGGQEIEKVTDYNESTHTITYTTLSAAPQTVSADSKYHYALYNHVKLISNSNQCAVDATGLKAYIWPSAVPTNMGISSLQYGIYTAEYSYITIDGFKFIGQISDTYWFGVAMGSANSGNNQGMTFQNNEIHGIDSTAGSATAAIYLSNSAGTDINYIKNNTISHVRGTRGITTVGGYQYVQNNTISYVHGTAIYESAANNGEISGNSITDGGGIHSNGISVYGGSGSTTEPPTAQDTVIKNNRAIAYKITDNWTGGGAATIEACDTLTFYNNVLDGRVSHWGVGAVAHEWLKFYNNIITESLGLYPAASTYPNLYIINNIIGGLWIGPTSPVTDWSTITNVSHTNNLYTAYTSQQSGSYGWSLGTGEVYNTNTALTFTNYAGYDFTHISASGLGVNTGTDLSGAGFATDILGATRPQGVAWDIGAYEYGGSAPTVSGITIASIDCSSLIQVQCVNWPIDSKALGCTTDIAATCKYDTSDLAYASMANTFSSTGGTTHSQTLSSLNCGSSYGYYVKCSNGGTASLCSFAIDKDPPPRRYYDVY